MSLETTQPDGVARRHLLTGAGVAAVAGLVAAGASPALADADTAAGGNVSDDTPVTPTVGSAAISGYAYRYASMFDFLPESTSVQRFWGGWGAYTSSGTTMWASMDIPAGARVRDLEWYVYNTSGSPVSCVGRVWAAGVGTLNYLAVDTQASSGTGVRAFRTAVPSSTYGPFPMGSKLQLGFNCFAAASSQINGVRVGFSNGAGAIGMLSSPVRAYDSREHSKLSAGATRTITLPTSVCPAGTTAVSANVIVVAAEGAGQLKVWPGHVSSTSSVAVNYLEGVTASNAQLVGVSASRKIRVWSSKKAHVVIEVSGTVG